MTQSELESATKEGTTKRRQPMLVWILIVALLAMAGACGYLWYAGKQKAGPEVPKVVLSKQEQYLTLDPKFVVNFRHGDEVTQHYLQIGVSLMSHDAEALSSAKEADPVIRNALVMLFSSQDADALQDAAGKQKLQSLALDQVRKIVAARLGRPGVEAVYFTSFVMQ